MLRKGIGYLPTLFIIYCATRTCLSQCPPPAITIQMMNMAATVGENSSFTVHACSGEEVFAWKDIEGNKIWQENQPDDIQDPRFDESHPTSPSETTAGEYKLIIKTVSKELAGKYEAELLLATDTISSSGNLVAVESMDGNEVCPTFSGDKREGQEVVLDCKVLYTGYLAPKIEWFDYNMVRLESNRDGEIEDGVRVLANVTAAAENSGRNYYCMLRFEGGEGTPPDYEDMCSTHFYVEYKVTKIDFYPNPDEEEGGILTLYVGDNINCSADGRPAPDYRWECPDSNVFFEQLLRITEDFVHEGNEGQQTECTCFAGNTIDGVDQPEFSRKVTFMAYPAEETGGSTQGSDGWKIAVGIIVPIVVIALIVGVVLYVMKFRKEPAKSVPENGVTVPDKPAYDNRNFQGSQTSVQPKPNLNPNPNAHPVGNPAPASYGGLTQQGYPGKGSPGYADLGVKHLSGSLPGSTSTINSIPDVAAYSHVNKDPQGIQRPPPKGNDTSV